MLRLTELLLFSAPFAATALWWWLGRRAGAGLLPTQGVLIATLFCLAVLGTCLVWFGLSRRLDTMGVYVPAELVGGRIIPGRTAPR